MNSSSTQFTNPRARYGFQGRSCSIVSVGSYKPERILTNADLEKIVDTSDEWIRSRTGIRERRIAAEGEFTSDMAVKAATKAMNRAGIGPEEIDLIIVATITPDMPFPSTACLVQEKLGARRAAGFDLEAACSGFIFALEVGQQFIMSRTFDTVLVIGAERLSSIVDWKDRNTCVLFGDGAGAAILRNQENAHGLLTTCMGSDGSKASLLEMPAGGSAIPATEESIKQGLHFLRMDGKETFKCAVNAMMAAATDALNRCNLSASQIKLVIPHQANHRIISAVGTRLGLREDQVYINVDRMGNTSAASVAIALDEAVDVGLIEKGDLILLVAFGAGLTWASAVIEW